MCSSEHLLLDPVPYPSVTHLTLYWLHTERLTVFPVGLDLTLVDRLLNLNNHSVKWNSPYLTTSLFVFCGHDVTCGEHMVSGRILSIVLMFAKLQSPYKCLWTLVFRGIWDEHLQFFPPRETFWVPMSADLVLEMLWCLWKHYLIFPVSNELVLDLWTIRACECIFGHWKPRELTNCCRWSHFL